MNFYYCQSCFKKTPQTASIVTCCSHCGKYFVNTSINNVKFTGGSVTTPIPEIGSREYNQQLIDRSEKRNRKHIKAEIEIDDLDDDNLDNDLDDADDGEDISVPHIDKLKVELEIPQNTGMSLASLAKGAERKRKPKVKVAPVDKKQFLAEFQKSASTLRKNK